MRPTDYTVFEQVISKPRLQSYRGYFQATLEEAVGMYMWNSAISSQVRVLLGYFEVALRNRVHVVLSQHYCQTSSGPWYDIMAPQMSPETRRKFSVILNKKDGTPKSPPPSPDYVASNLSFGTWQNVLKAIHSHARHVVFPSVFPHHALNASANDWKTNVIRTRALMYLDELNVARNRIAHHEPLWKFGAVKDTASNPPTLIAAATTNQAESVARLRRLLVLMDEGLRSMSPDLEADLAKSTWRSDVEFLLTDRGINRYRNTRYLPRASAISPATFRKQFGLLCRGNRPVIVAGSGSRGTYYP